MLRIPAGPLLNGSTVTEFEQFVARSVFVPGPSGRFLQPRIPYRVSGEAPRPFGTAPDLGQHDGWIDWAPRRVRSSGAGSDTERGVEGGGWRLPLAGVRIVDCTAWWAGPITTAALAALGADVIKVESLTRPDNMRFAYLLAAVLLAAGFGFKMAVFPFQMWVPDVYEGAPTPVTAYLSVASKAAAFAIVMRVFFTALSGSLITSEWAQLFAVLAAISMTFGNAIAIQQRNIKRLFGYSLSMVAERGQAIKKWPAAAIRLNRTNSFADLLRGNQMEAAGTSFSAADTVESCQSKFWVIPSRIESRGGI